MRIGAWRATRCGEREDEESAVTDHMSLPSDLPAPEDDGAADHLAGLAMPPITLAGTGGRSVALDDLGVGRTVLYIYPRTGEPGKPPPDGWGEVFNPYNFPLPCLSCV